MANKLSDEDAQRIAALLAENNDREVTIGPSSRVPVGWVLGGAVALVGLTLVFASAFAKLDHMQNNLITVKYMRLYSRDFELKNANIKAPNADEVLERQND